MTVLPRLALALSVTGLLVAGASAQAPARDPSRPAAPVTGTASITGVVTMAGSGQPAARARVSLGGDSTPRNTSTDELGRFAFTALPAGRYSLNASKSGYLGASYGQSRPGRPGTPVQLADGQQFEARLQMYRGGVLTGTVVDEHGELTAGTPLRVMRWNLQSGQRVLQSAGAGATDDRGIYRIYGLQPGDYIISATPRNTLSDADRVRQEIESIRQMESTGRLDDDQARVLAQRASQLQGLLGEDDEQPTGYAPVYYPGTTTPAQAATISLDAGEERVGLDFQLLRVPVARVEGTVINATGQPLPNLQIRLLPAGAAFAGQTASAHADQDGRFRLFNVAPGAYTIAATATVNPAARAQPAGGRGQVTRPEPQRYWATADLQVDGRNVSNLALALQPGLTLSGRILFEGTAVVPADFTRVRVSIAPADRTGATRSLLSSSAGRVDASGRFTIANIVPGAYRLSGGGAGQGWSIKSAIVEGQDTLDFPVDLKQDVAGAVVTFTDRQAEISGTVSDERGRPATTATVVLYPADEQFRTQTSRRIRATRPATDGTFTFTNVAPGDYRLAPAIDPEPGAWYEPAFLDQLDSGSIRITVGEGEKKSQALRVSSGGI